MLSKRIFALVTFALTAIPGTTAAQLRPLDPVDYSALSGPAVRFELGVAMYAHQHASLAGTIGTLWELGNVRLQIRTGRVVLVFDGTAQRFFHDQQIFAAPYGDTFAPPASGNRHDPSDFRAATVVRLTPDNSATLATLRFGTRLPTTNNRLGLDRDATDFFATAGAQHKLDGVALSAELGVGINGTRERLNEQADVLIYSARAAFPVKELTVYTSTVGQDNLHTRSLRGTEDLGELRAGVRTNGRRWINVAWVHGYRSFSPSNGVQLSAGIALR